MPDTTKSNVLKLQILIFLAGFTFLIMEVSWNRMLSLVLGSTVTASTIVLATFMAGFGSGAWFWGRAANHRAGVGRMLALLMGGIGLTAAADYWLITLSIPSLCSVLATSGWSVTATDLVAFPLAALLLFIPTFLMGGIFPLVTKLAVRSNAGLAVSVGRLFAIETLGSTCGGLITGFWLLGTFGQMQTMMIAVVINLLLAAWLFFSDQQAESVAAEKSRSSVDLPSLRRMALISTFACGFVNLGLQVAWMRMFRTYLTNTSYTFALVSSMSILGLFLGSYLFRKNAYKIADSARTMLRAVMLMALAALASLIMLIQFPQLFMLPFQELMSEPLNRVLLLPLITSLLIVVPPALVSGFAFPLACRMYAAGAGDVSRDVGFVMMVNTTGSVLGPLVVAFVLMPWLGAALSVLALAGVLMIASAIVLRQKQWQTPLSYVVYSSLLIMVVVLGFRPQITILPPSFSAFDRELLFYRESVEGTLSVGKDRGTRNVSKYTFVNNSAVIGSTYDAIKVVKMVGHLPFLVGAECRNVLVIGFGIGVTTSAIASHPEVESITCVELVPGLQDAARFYTELNHDVVADPRLNVVAGDGRHYLQITPETYDLISCDPTHPILGSGNLYTRDYFEMCRDHLNPGGMVSQYLPLHKLGPDEFLGLLKTFQSVFPDCTVWLGNFHAVMLGSNEALKVDFDQWSKRVAQMDADKDFYIEPNHLAATYFLDGSTIAELGRRSAINTDNLSYTEFFDADCLDADNISLNLKLFLENRVSLSTLFTNISNPGLLNRYLEGNRLMTESLALQFAGDRRGALQRLQEACRANPEDPEYPLMIRISH